MEVKMLQFVVCLFLCAYAQGLQVNTTEGVVEGSKAHDGEYFVFYGIPYAGPTEGQNRFKAPVPAPPYPGPFSAMDANVMCAQPTERGIMGVENCLTVNIFTKNVTTPKPVFVFLNSNEYKNTFTQNMFSFKDLVEKDIVFISMNFRLSVFGFLCLGVPEAPGNAGLKDVIHGLKWIQANIANFGGDPNNVVLVGHAAGAAMVDLITLSPQSENLVHKAIALSGSGLAPWAVAYEPIRYAQLLGNKLGYGGKSPAELAKHLVTTDINVIQTELADFKFLNNTPIFAPCIEDPNMNGSVIIDAPINVLRSGHYRHIPFIYGYTSKEGTFRVAEAALGNWLQLMQENFTDFLQVDLKFNENTTAEAANIRNFYFSNSAISMATVDDYLEYQGDTLVLVSTIRTAIERASTTSSEVRLVELDYMGTSNSDWIYNQVALNGAKHGDFLNYLFNFDIRTVDQPVRASIVNRFAGFAYNWNLLRNVAPWPPITRNITNYLLYEGNGEPLNNSAAIHKEEYKVNLHPQRMIFWNNLYDKYYVAPTSINSSNVAIAGLAFVMLCQLLVRFV